MNDFPPFRPAHRSILLHSPRKSFVLFHSAVVTSVVYTLPVPPAPPLPMPSHPRLPLLPLLSIACVCWTMLAHGPAAWGSCGSYLHSRLGPPSPSLGQQHPAPTKHLLQTSVTPSARRIDLGRSLPCTGPGMIRAVRPHRFHRPPLRLHSPTLPGSASGPPQTHNPSKCPRTADSGFASACVVSSQGSDGVPGV